MSMYNNLGDRGVTLFVMGIVGLVLTTLTFLLRLWTRIRIVKSFGSDDWVMVFTQLLYFWMTIDMIAMALLGFGQHEVNVSIDQIVTGFMHALLAELAYTIGVFCIRLSLCLLYFRITTMRWQRNVLWVLIVVNAVYGLGYFLLCLNQCQPVSYAWNQFISLDGSCLPSQIVPDASYAHNALSIATDWTLAIMPIFLLRDTKMNFRTKWSVIILLGLGSSASVAAIVRITVLQGLEHSLDYTYRVTPVIFWSSMETTLGIVANNITVCRPFFKKFLGDRTQHSATPYGSKATGFSKPTKSGYILNSSGHDCSISSPHEEANIGLARTEPIELTSHNSTWVVQKKSETFFETESLGSDDEQRLTRTL